MENNDVIPHLFRTEYRKIVSVLCRRFGLAEIEVGEDIASETFLTAAQSWGLEGLPANPTAWLYTVAKNKARNHLLRKQLFNDKVAAELRSSNNNVDEPVIDMTPQHMEDSQLHMMFALCHPVIPTVTQIALCLRVLCGFGIEEIADAFLTNKETINKRLRRGRERLREARITIGLPDIREIETRLEPVLKTIYLLYNEGYYSISKDRVLRKEFCLEAIRLCTMLVENNISNTPDVNALLSLMCFHTSRFEARFSMSGEAILYDEQDISLWNSDWIGKGGYFLKRAATGNKLTSYHIEAAIAYWSTQQEDSPEKWQSILQLYEQLLTLKYSPVAALNRTYALAKVKGNRIALFDAEKLKLTDNHFYYSLIGELYIDLDRQKALENFDQALRLAKTTADKQAIKRKISRIQSLINFSDFNKEGALDKSATTRVRK